MKLKNLYKILNILLLLTIIAILIPLFHSSISDTSSYKNIYKKIVSIFQDETKSYNLIIDQNVLNIMRGGNNTIYLRHSDDDKKNREGYLDALSTIEGFQSGNLNALKIMILILKKFGQAQYLDAQKLRTISLIVLMHLNGFMETVILIQMKQKSINSKIYFIKNYKIKIY